MQYTPRGFAIWSFLDTYGAACSVQKSSAAFVDRLWVGVDKSFNPKNTPNGSVRMHLSRGQAWQVAQLLTYFAEHGDLPETVPDIPEEYNNAESS